MTKSDSNTEEPTLRERKKQLTRQALIDTAQSMFAERGFDNVTVAEIAAAVDIAPKTVFVYFPNKDDLVFHDEAGLRRALVHRIRDRAPGDSALDALSSMLSETMTANESGPAAALDDLLRLVDDSPVLLSRMRAMWERFEQALAVELARETGEHPHAPAPRIAAAQLIAIFRTMASPDVSAYLRSYPASERDRAYLDWLGAATDLVGAGIGDYPSRRRD